MALVGEAPLPTRPPGPKRFTHKPMSAHPLRFREDIAGLRAIAVAPIVLQHAGLSIFPGGFAGVDIFFVISGFLITSILMRDEQKLGPLILHFYRRRAVRIMPALLLVLAAVLVAGSALMLPDELRDLGSSAAAAAGFSSNIYFWRTANYFDDAVVFKPLLHTWSLGVEEQFYILYPLFLYWLRRYASSRLPNILWAVVAISFGLSLALALIKPVTAFYVLPSRAWELALGGLIAVGGFPEAKTSGLRNALSLAGLALVGAGLFLIDENMPFPAPWAALPCVGTALLIAYGEQSITTRLVGLAPLRWLGAISYSLYLWHWPIMSFWRLRYGAELGTFEVVLVLLLSLVLATLTYVAVERPFLRRFNNGSAKPVVTVSALCILVAVVGSLIVARHGADWQRLGPSEKALLSYSDYTTRPAYQAQFRPGLCFSTSSDRRFDFGQCLALSSTKRNVVLLGDSHAAHLWRALADANPDTNLLQATGSGCKPVLKATGDGQCVAIVERVLGPLAASGKIARVILAARWTQNDVPLLLQTIASLRARGVAVTVIGPVVEYRLPLPRLIVRAQMQGNVDLVAEGRVRGPALVDERLAPLVRQAGADYVSIYHAECPSQCTVLTPDHVPMHFDYDHFTPQGARLLVDRMAIAL